MLFGVLLLLCICLVFTKESHDKGAINKKKQQHLGANHNLRADHSHEDGKVINFHSAGHHMQLGKMYTIVEEGENNFVVLESGAKDPAPTIYQDELDDTKGPQPSPGSNEALMKQWAAQRPPVHTDLGVAGDPGQIYDMFGHDPYPGVDYLGMGYDYVFGNPQGDPNTQVDPGFRKYIVDLVWDEANVRNGRTRDQRWQVPKCGYAYPENSCFQAQKSVKQSSSSDYSSSLSVDCSVSASVAAEGKSFGFSASAGAQQFAQNVGSTSSQRFQLTSYCDMFVVGLEAMSKEISSCDIPVHPHFLNVASALPKISPVPTLNSPVTPQIQQWMDFFKEFGTHFLTKVTLGGKMIHQVTMTSDTIKSIENQGMSAGGMVEGMYTATIGEADVTGHLKISASVSKSSKASKASANTDKEVKTFVFGGIPPADDPKSPEAFSDWADTVHDSPMPIRYEIMTFDHLTIPNFDVPTYLAMLTYWGQFNQPPQTELTKEALARKSGTASTLTPGDILWQGQKKINKEGTVSFYIQEDGNLVVYHEKSHFPLWASNTDQNPVPANTVYFLQYETHGNLCAYSYVLPDSVVAAMTATTPPPTAAAVVTDAPITVAPVTAAPNTDATTTTVAVTQPPTQAPYVGMFDLDLAAAAVAAGNSFFCTNTDFNECNNSFPGWMTVEETGDVVIYSENGDLLMHTGTTKLNSFRIGRAARADKSLWGKFTMPPNSLCAPTTAAPIVVGTTPPTTPPKSS